MAAISAPAHITVRDMKPSSETAGLQPIPAGPRYEEAQAQAAA